MRFRSLALSAVVASCLALATPSAVAQQVSGAGSTFVNPVMSRWSAEYGARTGVQVTYQPVGSAQGVTQVRAGTVDFGASEAPLPPAELRKSGLVQFPLVIGGIVPVVNLPGVRPGEMRLTGELLADIYLGKVRRWSDPAIRSLNPNLELPDTAISVIHRSDGSGTTYNWVDYLSKVSPEWRAKVGEGTSVSWPTGVGGKGNEGVAFQVGRVPGAIGYVEYAFVTQHRLTHALVRNAAGRFVPPGPESFQEAAASADWAQAEDFSLLMTNAPGEGAYPITATTFILMPRQPSVRGRSKAATDFFAWSLRSGQESARDLGYVALPPSLVTRVEAYVAAAIPGR
ncbi:phosphate ABC transporter substrate-binding protein PstS [Roseicella sp. DB1501]|uniref:phosphate ABC transporter substrate-binding protein PstS n=1 Tax=Roseicella sp. DB1501 TaxID=2730925 RepID=UPI001490BF56|nr:phosphate ABC transporter substrate-binding protein PstS [Roseicella sp. DB1501]NOG73636.1 phosphate ABC transporter substrate-binding protein PstS [Roseicella sp. DB1501]